ncbi:hypothetical protein GQ457_18G009490 [Hibiscus cannabinus]
MPNDWHNLLEVPGNRLPETGSRQMNFCILEVPGNRLPNTGSNMAEDVIKKKYTFQEPAHQKEGRRIVKDEDLKPKRIKDYLEYKFSQRSLTLLKELNSRNEVNTVHVRDQKHELAPPRNRYPCDNGYKEVTVLPLRDIVYDQVKQLIGLRHKPITPQDALPRSDSSRDFLPRQDPLSLFETSPFVILLKQNIKTPP